MKVLHAQRARCILLALVAQASLGLVVSGPEPERSERPPPTDPGWSHVGEREGRSAVYLGRGWVLTAAHVGAGPVSFQGETFPPVPDSAVRLKARGVAGRMTDLLLFRVDPAPKLRSLGIRKSPVRPNTPLLMVGYGRGRGGEVRWMNRDGYRYRSGAVKKRWGTNQVEAQALTIRDRSGSQTRCFQAEFSRSGTAQEAQAAPGDSGGAVFAKGATRWKLAGLMLAVVGQRGQPSNVALYGDRTSIADLSRYRHQILARTGRATGSQQPRRSKRAASRGGSLEASADGTGG